MRGLPVPRVAVAPVMRIMYDRVARFFSLLYVVMVKSGLLEKRTGCPWKPAGLGCPLQSMPLLWP